MENTRIKARQLIVCIDGTNNRFSDEPTNVVRLFRSLPKDSETLLAYYDQGVGTFGLSETLFEWQKVPSRIAGLMFGWGLKRNVLNAYRFLMENYRDGDQIFLFGFSRGSYAVRVLAALLYTIGLLPAHQVQLMDFAWSLLTTRQRSADNSKPNRQRAMSYTWWRMSADKKPDFDLMEAFKGSFARPVSIHFLGLFDTVSSVGWVYDPLIVPYTRKNKDVKIIRHAVSLDERRSFFRQNLWTEGEGVNLKQVWFAGVHADVGGGYPAGESQLALIALRWMIGECLEAGLSIDAEACRAELYPPSVLQDPLAQAHNSLTRNWLIAEWVPRLVWNPKTHKRTREYGSMPPFGKARPRVIPTPENGQKIRVHASVAARQNGPLNSDQSWGSQLSYQPQNLPDIDSELIEQVGDSPRLDEYNL
ncbi:T6SS phospholipase effector Tle1-like catalytic domain-containing protein [Pseudomonas sp. 22526]|uniref:T6SS phospholipase effector Tle1-like catalytic domain-containing protein n=1 Tax=Pseudomonas sp. 22526 TaxID=3453937 RepID=UPI003F87D391